LSQKKKEEKEEGKEEGTKIRREREEEEEEKKEKGKEKEKKCVERCRCGAGIPQQRSAAVLLVLLWASKANWAIESLAREMRGTR
jgi:hypothetical protein